MYFGMLETERKPGAISKETINGAERRAAFQTLRLALLYI
jgi:hypothetical protein